MGIMGNTNHEVRGFRRAVEFWGVPGRAHCSAEFMRAAARGFERSKTAQRMHPDEVKSFIETIYTLSKTR